MEQGTISVPKGEWSSPGQKRVTGPGREQVLMAKKGYFQRESRFSAVDMKRICHWFISVIGWQYVKRRLLERLKTTKKCKQKM